MKDLCISLLPNTPAHNDYYFHCKRLLDSSFYVTSSSVLLKPSGY
jgi:hypothetical protein